MSADAFEIQSQTMSSPFPSFTPSRKHSHKSRRSFSRLEKAWLNFDRSFRVRLRKDFFYWLTRDFKWEISKIVNSQRAITCIVSYQTSLKTFLKSFDGL